jgi:hypothetical protein
MSGFVCLHRTISCSILLIHQFVFFFLLCLDIIDCQEPENNEEGLALVRWVSEMAAKVAENRPELGPIILVTRSMTAACEQVRLGASDAE